MDDKLIKIISAVNSNYIGMVALVDEEDNVYLGKKENYHFRGQSAYYDNSDNSLCFISHNSKIFSFLYGSGWVLSQEEMLQYGFTMELYKEFDNLQKGKLKEFKREKEIYFKDKSFLAPEELEENEEEM